MPKKDSTEGKIKSFCPDCFSDLQDDGTCSSCSYGYQEHKDITSKHDTLVQCQVVDCQFNKNIYSNGFKNCCRRKSKKVMLNGNGQCIYKLLNNNSNKRLDAAQYHLQRAQYFLDQIEKETCSKTKKELFNHHLLLARHHKQAAEMLILETKVKRKVKEVIING